MRIPKKLQTWEGTLPKAGVQTLLMSMFCSLLDGGEAHGVPRPELVHSPQVNLKQSFGVQVSCCHWMGMQRDLVCCCRWWPKACHVHTERASGDRLPGQKPCRQSQGNTVDRRSRAPVSMLKETMKDGHQSEPVF